MLEEIDTDILNKYPGLKAFDNLETAENNLSQSYRKIKHQKVL